MPSASRPLASKTIPDIAVLLTGVEGLSRRAAALIADRYTLSEVAELPTSALAPLGLAAEVGEAVIALARDPARCESHRRAIATNLGANGLVLDGPELALLPGVDDLGDPPVALASQRVIPLDVLRRPRIAVVGSRQPSAYGKRVASTLGADLARAGALVLSGGALGVDLAAQEGALDGGGETIGVLGASFASELQSRGAHLKRLWRDGYLLSEELVQRPVQPWMYPRRNRLIAALAQAVVVVEGRLKSGSLITARWAHKLGRKLLAVPGRIDQAEAEAPNSLLAAGAAVCRGVDDILIQLAPAAPVQQDLPLVAGDVSASLDADLSPLAERVLRHLGAGAGSAHVDELALALSLAPGELAATQLELELASMTFLSPGQIIALTERAMLYLGRGRSRKGSP